MGRNKRKASAEGDNTQKSGRCTSTPEQVAVTVSDVLKDANSVLFSDSVENLLIQFEVSESSKSDTPATPSCSNPSESKSTAEIMSCKTCPSSGSDPSLSDVMCCLNEIHRGMKGIEAHVKSNSESLKVFGEKVGNFEKEISKLWNYIHDKDKCINERVAGVEEKVESVAFGLGLATERIQSLENLNENLRDELTFYNLSP